MFCFERIVVKCLKRNFLIYSIISGSKIIKFVSKLSFTLGFSFCLLQIQLFKLLKFLPQFPQNLPRSNLFPLKIHLLHLKRILKLENNSLANHLAHTDIFCFSLLVILLNQLLKFLFSKSHLAVGKQPFRDIVEFWEGYVYGVFVGLFEVIWVVRHVFWG